MTPFCSTFFSFHVFVFSGCSDSSIYITACLSALVAVDFLHLRNVPSDLLGFGDQMAKIVRIEYWVRVNRAKTRRSGLCFSAWMFVTSVTPHLLGYCPEFSEVTVLDTCSQNTSCYCTKGAISFPYFTFSKDSSTL